MYEEKDLGIILNSDKTFFREDIQYGNTRYDVGKVTSYKKLERLLIYWGWGVMVSEAEV